MGCSPGEHSALTFKELWEIRIKLQNDWDACIAVLHKSTNPVFLLWNMVEMFTSNDDDIRYRRQAVVLGSQFYCHREIINERRALDRDLNGLHAMDIAVIFSLIDTEFFGGSISCT